MNEDYKDNNFYLRIGLDGTPELVDEFAKQFSDRVYNETLHAQIITTDVHLDNYNIKVDLLKT
ncbi:25348_t:CDS:2, partial [Gigaspora margarita]